MNKTTVLIFLFFSFTLSAKEIAITIDDSPRSADGLFDGPTRAKLLVENLKKHNLEQIAFFSVSSQLDDEGIQRLKTYSDAGHIIANHTHSHPDFNGLSLAEYSENFLQADTQLRQFKTFRPWFRFPYLREGDTAKKRDGMRALLSEQGYLNAYITLNNYDWYIESLFQQAIKEHKQFDFDAMGRFYVQVLMESIEYYDEMAQTHLKRSPKHVLLLHEMDITALFIGNLVDELRTQGWTIITAEQAYADPISDQITDNLMRFNPGRIGEIAKDNNQKKGLWHSSLEESYLKEQFEKEVLNAQ